MSIDPIRDDPFAPFYAALAHHYSTLPSTNTMSADQVKRMNTLRQLQSFSASGPVPGLNGFISELLGAPTLPEGMQSTATGGTIDITDPSVDVGDQDLSLSDKLLRGMRYLGRAMHGAALGKVGPLTPGSGIKRLMMEGQLAQPRNAEEKALLFMAPLLTQMGILLPVGAVSGTTQAVTQGARSVASVAGEGAAFGAGTGLAESLTETGLPGIGNTLPGQDNKTFGGVVKDVAVGAVGGAAAGVFLGKVVPWGFRLLLGNNAATPANLAKTSATLDQATADVDNPFVPGPGMVVAGKRAVQTPSGLRWLVAEGEGRGGWAKAPTDEEFRTAGRDLRNQALARAGASPEGEAAQEAVAAATPNDPETLPQSVADPSQVQQMQTLGALYYRQQAGRLYKGLRGTTEGGQLLQRQLQTLKTILVDPSLSEGERLTAGGRVMALEKVLGEGQTPTGLAPFEVESAALEMVKSYEPVYGKAATLAEADKISLTNPELAARIRALTDSDIPEAVHDQITARLKKADKLASRGFKQGSAAIYNGKAVRVLTDPEYGLMQVANLVDKDATPQYVGAEDLIPVPRAGTFIRTKGQFGPVIKVESVMPEKGIVTGFDVETKAKVQVPVGDIFEIADAPASQKSMKSTADFVQQQFGGDETATPPVKAVTATGEPVTVQAVGSKTLKVKTKSGRVKTVATTSVEPSTVAHKPVTAAAGSPTPDRFIVSFAPGTIPDEGHKILYFRVAKDAEDSFRQGWQSGQWSSGNPTVDAATLPGGLNTKTGDIIAHVLPPALQDPAMSLYALEANASDLPLSQYSDLAKKALKALGGTSELGTYLSPVDVPQDVFNSGRIYKVPDELHAGAQRPESLFQFMSKDEQRDYLRNLLTFNENIDSDYAVAADQSRRAVDTAAEAIPEHDSPKLADAEASHATAVADAADAFLKQQFGDVDANAGRKIDAAIQDLRAKDRFATERAAFEAQGLTPATTEFWMNELATLKPSEAKGLAEEELIAPSSKVPGLRVRIALRTRPGVKRVGRDLIPTQEKFYSVTPVGPDGKILREGEQAFSDPAELTSYLVAHDYAPTTYRSMPVSFYHPDKPGLVASIIDRGETPTLIEQKRVEVPTLAAGKGARLTKEQQAIMLHLSETQQDAASGETRYLPKAGIGFATQEEAANFARSLGYKTVNDEVGGLNLANRFQKLPPISHLEDVATGARTVRMTGTKGGKAITRDYSAVETLKFAENKLLDLITQSQRVYNYIPEAVMEYASRFADLYEEVVGDGPFNKEIRSALGIPTIADQGPRPPQSIDYENVVLPNVKFKGGFTPTPAGTRVGDQPGVYEVGDILDIEHEMHLHGSDMAPRPPFDAENVGGKQTLFGKVLGVKSGPIFSQIRRAADEAVAQQIITKNAEAFAKANDLLKGGPAQFSPSTLNVGRYSPTNQVVQIVDVNLANGEMRIKFPEGDEMSVSSDQVQQPTRKTRSPEQYSLAMANLIVEGRYNDFFKREPALGFGDVERKLGIFGTNDPNLVVQTFSNKAYELASQLVGKGEDLQGPKDVIDELLDLHIRSQELETTKALFFGKRAVQTVTDAESAVMDAIRARDPGIEKPFRYASYRRARAQFGDTPMGDLQAAAQAGFLKASDRQRLGLPPLKMDAEVILRDLAKEYGYSPDLPLTKLVQEARARNLIDANVARMTNALNNQFGFLGRMQAANIPDGVKISIPRTEDIGIGARYLGIPAKLFSRHPFAKLLYDTVRVARKGELEYGEDLKSFVTELSKMTDLKLGYRSKDSLELQRLVETYDNWEEAAKAGTPDRFQYAFHRYGQFMDQRLEDHIRYFLSRRIEPVRVNVDEIRAASAQGKTHPMAMWLLQHGIDPDQVTDGFAILDRGFNQDYGFNGEQSRGYTHDDIETFLSLRRQYGSAAELPPDTDPRFTEWFDFWKRYGRKKYWPIVHEGNVALTVKRGGKDVYLGIAPSYLDAAELFSTLAKEGKIAAGEQLALKEHNPTYDDILSQNISSNRDWRNVTSAWADQIDGETDAMKALFLKTEQEGAPESLRRGKLVSAEPRSQNQRSPFDDPMRSLGVYNARIGRSMYRYKVAEAMRLYNNTGLDESLSASHNVQPLHSMKNLSKAMVAWFHDAIGEYSLMDKVADTFMKYVNWMKEAPLATVRNIRDGGALPWKDILLPSSIYERTYSGRSAAASAVSNQSWYRLGGILPTTGSAIQNFTQYWVTTYPKLLEAGVNPVEASTEALRAWKDGTRLWYATAFRKPIPADLADLAPLIEQVGVQLAPTKQVAGASNFNELTAAIPDMAGKTKLEYGVAMARWWSMLGFNGGEYTNRYATAVAMLRRRMAQGHTPGEAVAAAQQLITDTHFDYDELAIPEVIRNAGPLGRVLFQFKPYLFNFLSYEKDLLRNALTRQPAALRQLGAHAAMVGVMGGAAGLMYHPAMSAVGAALHLVTGQDYLHILGHDVPLTAEALQAKRDQDRRAFSTPEQQFTTSMAYKWDDLLYYGVPGLLHFNMAQRIGVSGQDLVPNDPMSLLGPTVSSYVEFGKAWAKYAQQSGSTAGVLGGAAGVVLGQQLFRSSRALGNSPIPFPGLLTSLVTGAIASKGSPNPFGAYLATRPEGHELASRVFATSIRNAMRTYDLFKYGSTFDMDGRPMHVPNADRNTELLSAAIGIPSIKQSEYRAVMGLETGQSGEYNNTRETFIDRIAEAVRDGDNTKAWQAALDANELGIYIPESAIQQRLEDLANEALQTVGQRQNVFTRY